MIATTVAKPAILVDLKKYRIRIHKNTLHAIGNPNHILLLVNPEERTLAIMCSDRSDPRAHHVMSASCSNNKSFELYSRSLVNSLHDICSSWQNNQSYRICGEIIPNEGVAWFHMDESILINQAES